MGPSQNAGKNIQRIVPVRQPKAKVNLVDLEKHATVKPDAVTHKLVYNGGPLLANVEVFTVFLGTSWLTAPDRQTIAKDLNAFFGAILTSPLIDQLAEYNVPAYAIGHGRLTGSVTITSLAPGTITETQFQGILRGWINAGTVHRPNANTLYFIYNDESINIEMDNGWSICEQFCGFHNSTTDNLYYGIVPYPACFACLGDNGLTPFQAYTSTSSHELCESITDPVPGKGWYEYISPQLSNEIADICMGHTKTVLGYTVQQEWSNAQNACV